MLYRLMVKRLVWFAVAAVALLCTIAFVAPPIHGVHTPGGIAIVDQLVHSNVHIPATELHASQSISDIRCQIWRQQNRATSCPDDVAQTAYFPERSDDGPRTLYIPWGGCGSMDWRDSQNYNIEYIAPVRKLVIHCYSAEPLISLRRPLMGVAATPLVNLLVVPTIWIGAATVEIVEDDRIERLGGDQRTELRLGTVTIAT